MKDSSKKHVLMLRPIAARKVGIDWMAVLAFLALCSISFAAGWVFLVRLTDGGLR